MTYFEANKATDKTPAGRGGPKRLFVDMDGTLAVFTPVGAIEELYEEGFFGDAQPHWQAVDAVRLIAEERPDVEVYILSAYLADSPHALSEKNAWLDTYLPEIGPARRIFTPCGGGDKAAAVPGGVSRGDFLLDDYTLNLLAWDPPGSGVKALNGINHTRGTWRGPAVSVHGTAEHIAGAILGRMDAPPRAAGEHRRGDPPCDECRCPDTDRGFEPGD